MEEALDSLVECVPDWHVQLDDLNGKIASRQQELARLDDYRPPTRSLKNQGSTESLRPKDDVESPTNIEDKDIQFCSEPPANLMQPSDSPAFVETASPAIMTPTKDSIPPPLLAHNSSPGPAIVLQRRTSDRIASNNFIKPNIPLLVRKRKTASIASNDSQAPKYRTRSMIIVYYDSAVQNAFGELVKHISACRNTLRRAKMAARMADMRRMADDETASDDDMPAMPPTLELKASAGFYGNGDGRAHLTVSRNDLVDREDSDMKPPQLQFVSTRKMGPSRDMIAAQRNAASATPVSSMALPPIPGMLRTTNLRGSGLGGNQSTGAASIFDELDAGLEWCQSMCEHAAHQFLRDGDCSNEIESIKRRLTDVKECAEKKQVENAQAEVAAVRAKMGNKIIGTPTTPKNGRSLKPIQLRRSPYSPVKSQLTSPLKAEHPTPVHVLAAMEVDEGYGDEDDEEPIPKLVWRSTRAM